MWVKWVKLNHEPKSGSGHGCQVIAWTRQQGLVLYIGKKGVNVAARPPEGSPAETGGISASNLSLISISHPARMPEGPAKAGEVSTTWWWLSWWWPVGHFSFILKSFSLWWLFFNKHFSWASLSLCEVPDPKKSASHLPTFTCDDLRFVVFNTFFSDQSRLILSLKTPSFCRPILPATFPTTPSHCCFLALLFLPFFCFSLISNITLHEHTINDLRNKHTDSCDRSR